MDADTTPDTTPDPTPAPGADGPPPGDTVDALVVGAGIVGIYQLHRLVEAGFTVRLLEAGDGVGGTWFWNRYPQARFDSESYTYGYIHSKELFDEWQWSEHFAAQPEIERYLNHAVDRFDLRRHMTFGTRVDAARFDEATGTWLVHARRDDAGRDDRPEVTVRCRHLIAATGVLSIPYFPDVPGRESFAGEAHHTGLWPQRPVEFAGKRVAVVGTGSSGVQLIPAIADDVESLTVYQRTANWCTPLNNRPITAAEQAELRAGYERMREILETSASGFLHEPNERATFDDSAEERQRFYEAMWASPGFTKLTSNYTDVLRAGPANEEWCAFLRAKIRGLVDDPETAERLIPHDHGYAEKRPPFVTDYYETFNRPNVSLVDLQATPMRRVTPTGIETTDGERPFDIIVWATGFDFGTGALNRMGIRGRHGIALAEHWADGPTTYLGIVTRGFPNLYFPGGPHGATGNNPRYAGDQVDFVTDLLVHARERGIDVVEVRSEAQDEWMRMVDGWVKYSPFNEKSYFFGTNVPGKPTRYLLNPGGRPKLLSMIAAAVESGYDTVETTTLAAVASSDRGDRGHR
jgi:cation diffusion facilitator CzcD-associated flavoprotein CzcO